MAASGFEGLLTGHTLAERYSVDEVIGRGGFAAVYRATDARLGRTVAVKVITQNGGSAELRDEIQRRFEREARAIAMLHHPNVVTVYDFGVDPGLGLDFLVMELLRGEVLSDRLKRAEPLPVPEALRILRDAAWGVEAGHRAGLIHRDIKPGNIFLADPGHAGPPRVVVLDFGIARVTEAAETTQLTHSGRGFLSPAYASPEQLRGERPVTAAADVFSLGVIGYHLLAREKPFLHDRLHPSPIDRAPAPLLERNAAVPPAVAAVIERAMHDTPAERYPDASAFVAALIEAMDAADSPAAAAPAAPAAATEATRIQPPATEILPTAAPPADAPSSADARAPADAPAPRDAREADGGADDLAPPHVYAAAAPVIAATVDPPVGHPSAPVGDDARDEVPPRSTVDDLRRDIRASAPPATQATRPARRVSPALIAVPMMLVIAIALWLTLGHRGAKDDRVASAPAAESPSTAPASGSSGGAERTAGGAAPSTATPSANPATGGAPARGEPAAGGILSEPSASASGRPATAAGSSPATSGPIRSADTVVLHVPTAPGVTPKPGRVVVIPRIRNQQPGGGAPVAASAGGEGARALNHEGESLFDRGEVEAAVGRFRAAVRAAPGNAYYHNNLGWALFQAGQVEEAGRELNEAVRLDPRRDIAYANIGEVERARGNVSAAIAAYERFLELNTDPRRERIAREKLRSLRGG